jgi:predicted nucleotidyltransferase
MPELEPPEDLFPILSSLTRWFGDQKVEYAIIGGVAIGLVSQPRVTHDVDAVLWLDLDLANDFVESGKPFGFEPRIPNPVEFARNSRVLLLHHQKSNIGIDLSLGVLPFEREMLDRSREMRVRELGLRVATPEDLVILKAVAHRTRDLIDIDNLLNVHRDLDFTRIRYWVRQFADVLESPELVSNLEKLLKSHGLPES